MIMARFAWTALLLVVGAGCLPMRMELDKATPDKHVSKSRPIPKSFAPVTPQQVTKENARDMSAALWEEMDRAEVGDLLPEDNSPTPKKKK